jgi:hypothetical protein
MTARCAASISKKTLLQSSVGGDGLIIGVCKPKPAFWAGFVLE